jgi:zinc protease
MAERQREVPELDIRSLPGPETIRREELDNGIVVLARANFSSPSVVISGFLRWGSLDEPREKAGLADLTAASLLRGTARRSFEQIYEDLESIGATFHLGAGKHTTSFFGKALAEDLPVLLELLAEVLTEPTFPKEEVERLRAEKITGLTLREQNTGARAHLAFSELAYPEHPYAYPSDGYIETVKTITRRDLRAFHRRMGPQGMVIAVAGAVDPRGAVEAVAQYLGGWTNPRQGRPMEVPPAPPPPGLVRKDVPLPGKAQCDMVIGTPGPSRFHPHYLAAALGNNILGRFGMMGRIGDKVREKAGMAYYAYSTLGGGPGPSPWQVVAGVNPANVERALELIRQEIRRFVSRKVTRQELLDNQANFIGRLPLQLETNEGVATAMVHIEHYQLGLDYYQRYPALVRAVTREQILEVARQFLHPERLAIGVAGPLPDKG